MATFEETFQKVLEKILKYPKIGEFEKFIFPMIKSTWPNLIASDLLDPKKNIIQAPPNVPLNKMIQPLQQLANKQAKYMSEQEHMPNYVEEAKEYFQKDSRTTLQDFIKNFSSELENYYYGLILRNPFSYDSKGYNEFLYLFLIEKAQACYRMLKKQKDLNFHDDKEMLDSIQNLHLYRNRLKNERDCDVWFVLVELLEQNLVKS